jgi:hypothetical protein
MAFGRVNEKLKEHYGISVPEHGIRTTTLRHAKRWQALQAKQLGRIETPAKRCVISQTDGSMVPIVKPLDGMEAVKGDRRKKKALFYREIKLTLAHEKGSVTPRFSATFGEPAEAGKHILHCVKLVGMDAETQIHGLGDGATWISDQMEEQFGSQATYLVDFYHVCEYLTSAADRCAPEDKKSWLAEQEAKLKASLAPQVLFALAPHLETEATPEASAPVRACYRYLSRRLHQLDYKSALESGLPIGSGEIESAHRYVVQKRLKLPGAWWLEENAASMLALRVGIANQQWDHYWQNQAA